MREPCILSKETCDREDARGSSFFTLVFALAPRPEAGPAAGADFDVGGAPAGVAAVEKGPPSQLCGTLGALFTAAAVEAG